MTETELRGAYRVLKADILREKANRNDPRKDFYKAMLQCRTYEAYLAEVGRKTVEVESYASGPISGRMEILYARRNGWIADAN
jgi:hypothetical protein